MLGSNNGEENSGTRTGEKRAGEILSEFILGSATNGLASPVSSTSLTTGHVDLQLFGAIHTVLKRSPGRTAREVADILKTTRTDINQVLYRRPTVFRKDQSDVPRWHLTS